MSQGLPYVARKSVTVTGDPEDVIIQVPPRGYVLSIVAKSTAADAFSITLYAHDPADTSPEFSIDTYQLAAAVVAVAGVLKQFSLSIPYALDERDDVGVVVPDMYLRITGSASATIDIALTIATPDSRS